MTNSHAFQELGKTPESSLTVLRSQPLHFTKEQSGKKLLLLFFLSFWRVGLEEKMLLICKLKKKMSL